MSGYLLFLSLIIQVTSHNLQQQLPLKTHRKLSRDINSGSLYISTVFHPVEGVSHSVRSLTVDFLSRTHKHGLINCLDCTTVFLNPGFSACSNIGIVSAGTTSCASGNTGYTSVSGIDLEELDVFEECCSEVEGLSDDSDPGNNE